MNTDPLEPARLVRGLLRLYPADWRARFADEFAAVLVAVLAQGGRRWRVALDVVAGALDAHLHRSLEPGRKSMSDRIRPCAQVAFCAFVVFCLAGSGFQKMTEDPAFGAAGRAHAAVAWSYGVVLYGAIAAALAVLAGSLPVLLAVARQARAGRRDLRRLLLVPPAALIAAAGLIFGVTRRDHASVHSTVNVVTFLGVVLTAIAAVAVSTAALVMATRRTTLPVRLERVQWMPLTGLSFAMAAVTGADLVWGLVLRAQAPGLFNSDNGLLATSLPTTWLSTLAVLAAASAVTLTATVRAIRLTRGGPAGPAGPPLGGSTALSRPR